MTITSKLFSYLFLRDTPRGKFIVGGMAAAVLLGYSVGKSGKSLSDLRKYIDFAKVSLEDEHNDGHEEESDAPVATPGRWWFW